MADKNFKVKNGLDIGDNVATSVTKTIINTDTKTTLDSALTGTIKSADYSLTLYQGRYWCSRQKDIWNRKRFRFFDPRIWFNLCK